MNVLGQSRKFPCALSYCHLLCVMMSLKAIKLFLVCQEKKRELRWFKTVLKIMIFQKNNADKHYEIMSTLLFHYILLMLAHI